MKDGYVHLCSIKLCYQRVDPPKTNFHDGAEMHHLDTRVLIRYMEVSEVMEVPRNKNHPFFAWDFRIFHEINHPAIGISMDPPFMETTI